MTPIQRARFDGSLRLGRLNTVVVRCQECGTGCVAGQAHAAIVDGLFVGWLCWNCEPEPKEDGR